MNKLSVADKAAERRANHWVDPSFIDLREECSSLSGRRNGNPVLCSKAELKRKRKREASVSYLLKESSQLDQNEPWVDKYSPRSQAELAVHKKKIEEVKKWIRVHTNTKSGILLLTGPSGCGKTATVRVLSLEMGLRLQEWISPTNIEAYSSSHEWRMNGFSCSSQSSQFQDFLLRANKYSCLKMAGDGGVTHNKLILVEDLPNQFYRQPGALHEILRRFVRTSQRPLLFIVSDSLSGDSGSRFLFPKDVQEELGMSSIRFWKLLLHTLRDLQILVCVVELDLLNKQLIMHSEPEMNPGKMNMWMHSEIRPHVSARPLQQEKMGYRHPREGQRLFPGGQAPDTATATHTKAICSVTQSLTLNPPTH